ncbi:hypothetical protein Pla175_41910 [Pirellulimonas nuda]|uniref:Uncharacterized protein n=1 Tax=Pirellulimonas nuda TaxID=2528009 RepID=A0A518DH28_9BACT|nr:hypothetical protein [Pirellulimonas nuda]QDU90778.1 hypothetical protein Pla175_41910 [Pirellulimonas nuda]
MHTTLLTTLAQAARPAIDATPPPSRAAMLMAILGLVLLGIGMIVCVMLGARWVRKIAREQPRPPLERRRQTERPPEVVPAAPIASAADSPTSGRTLADSQRERETRIE